MSGSTRVAIVTGASRGIGRATALRLAQDFHGLVLVSRSQAGLNQVAESVEAAGAEARILPVDLRRETAAAAVVEMAIKEFGRIDALVNIAGAVPQTDLFIMTEEEWSDGFSLKFHGARRLALRAWDALRKTQGSVVFMSGVFAITPKASLAAVGAINAAISALAKAFSERGVTEGVQVNAVLPGAVMTDRRRSMLRKYAESHGLAIDQAAEHFAKEIGIARYGTPEDIASLIAFLVSPSAQWMTGTTLRIDGGEIKSV